MGHEDTIQSRLAERSQREEHEWLAAFYLRLISSRIPGARGQMAEGVHGAEEREAGLGSRAGGDGKEAFLTTLTNIMFELR